MFCRSLIFTLPILFYTNFLLANKQLVYNYIEKYKSIAVDEMRRTGIPASIKLAQGIMESDIGRSTLALEANNHFGIKCGKSWSGLTFQKFDDDKDSLGVLVQSCFRVYANAHESYIAHSEFLLDPTKKSRYGFLFDLDSRDFEGWANGLSFAGYATDPQYPSKLIKTIKTYKLDQYDEFIPKELTFFVDNVAPPKVSNTNDGRRIEENKNTNIEVASPVLTHRDVVNDKSGQNPAKNTYKKTTINGLKAVIAYDGQSLHEVAMASKVDIYELMEYNERLISPFTTLNEDEIVFIEKKKKSFTAEKKEFHVVKAGENLYSIAQQYGIRLESLMHKNNLPEDAIPVVGSKVSLSKFLTSKETPKYRVPEKFDSFVDLGSFTK